MRSATFQALGDTDPRGSPELRNTLMEYLGRARGASPEPEHTLIAERAGLSPIPVAVDADGIGTGRFCGGAPDLLRGFAGSSEPVIADADAVAALADAIRLR